jgi:hypothetical protein
VLLNLAVSVLGTIYFGIGGVIIGSLAQAVIKVPICFRVMKLERGLSIRDMIPRQLWSNAAFVAVVGSILFLIVRDTSIVRWTQFGAAILISTILLYSYGIWLMFKLRLLSS